MDSKAVILLKTVKEVELEVNGEKQKHAFEFEFSMQYGAPFKCANEALYDFIEEVARQAKEAMKRQENQQEPEASPEEPKEEMDPSAVAPDNPEGA